MRDKYYVWDGKELSNYFAVERQARERAVERLKNGAGVGLVLKCVAVARGVVVFDDPAEKK